MTPNQSSSETASTPPTSSWDDQPWDQADQLADDLAEPIEHAEKPVSAAPAPEAGRPLPRRPRRKLVTPVTGGLAAVVLAAGGFAGGVTVQKGRGGSTANAAAGGPPGLASSAPSGMPSGLGMPGAPAAGAPASGQPSGESASRQGGASSTGGTTVGEVSNVKGSTLYVTTSSGTTVRVVGTDGAAVQRTSKAAMTSVHPGDSVVVTGTTKSDGTVAATTVTATAAGVSAGAGAFGGMGTRP